MNIRNPAVAGTFYPSDVETLTQTIGAYLHHASLLHHQGPQPAMLIVPHAGYVFSGQIAANAYVYLHPYRQNIKRVVLMGPSHRVALQGIAFCDADFFLTPLGRIKVDRGALQSIAMLPVTTRLNEAHELEHSLEVQLPFLQSLLADFELVPLVVGQCSAQEVADVLETLWQPQTLIVISSDLSHYHSDGEATALDAGSIDSIKAQSFQLSGNQACGHYPLNGALLFAQQHHWNTLEVSRGNSGDINGDRTRVVGYASFVSYEIDDE